MPLPSSLIKLLGVWGFFFHNVSRRHVCVLIEILKKTQPHVISVTTSNFKKTFNRCIRSWCSLEVLELSWTELCHFTCKIFLKYRSIHFVISLTTPGLENTLKNLRKCLLLYLHKLKCLSYISFSSIHNWEVVSTLSVHVLF